MFQRTIITSIVEHSTRRTAARAARALLRPTAVGRATFRGGDLRRYVPRGDVGRYVPRARCSGRNCKQFASLSLGCSLAAANRAPLRDLSRPAPLRAFVRPHCTSRARPPSSVAARPHHAQRFYICEVTFVKLFTVVKLHLWNLVNVGYPWLGGGQVVPPPVYLYLCPLTRCCCTFPRFVGCYFFPVCIARYARSLLMVPVCIARYARSLLMVPVCIARYARSLLMVPVCCQP